MDRRASRLRTSALLIQLVGIVGVGALLIAAPPASGRMLLVPTTAASEHGMIALAVDHGASLIGPGPFPGSFIVQADRAVLLDAALASGVALLAAPEGGCGR